MFNRPYNTVLARLGLVAAVLATLLILAPAASAADAEYDYAEDRTDAVATFSASDPDADTGDIEWSLEGVDKDIFKISDEGVLTFEEQPNFEDAMDGDEDTAAAGDQRAGDNVYQITVVASGGELAVAVTVTDVDEPGEVTFDQPQPQATRDLTAIGPGDKDADVDDVSWQWSRCTTKDNADDCEDIAGATTTTRTPTADDVGMYLRATVTYTDTHGDQMASAATDNPVEPRTLANAAPEFDDLDPITVNENVEGDIGEPIMATDDDNDILLYSEDGNTGDNAMFSVSSSGQISLDDELDYETPGGGKTGNADPTDEIPDDAIVYTVMVKATDPSGAEGKSSVDVYLMDVEETPVFGDDAPETLWVTEGDDTQLRTTEADDASADLTSGAYTATDPGENNAPVYGIEGADAEDFTFDSSNAALAFPDPADFEKQSSYSITLTVTDAETDKFNKLDVTVKVVDAEDEGEVDLSAREPQNGYAVVATLDDPDGGETAITWQWYRGGDSTTATVDALVMLRPATESSQNDTCTAVGAVRENVASTASPCIIDGQTSALYTPGDDDETHLIHAVATYKDAQDPNTEETAKGSSERAVQEANPANTAPVFPDQDLNTAGDQSDTAMRSVAENMEDVNVGEPLEAADLDLLTYKLTGPDADSFEIIDPAPGSNSVQIKTAVELDFEAQSMHTVVLTASDPSGASDMITVMITVTDGPDDAEISLTESACEMDDDTMKCTYAEDREDAVGTFSASDPDADTGDIEWSLEGVDKDIFKISDEGVLTFEEQPNFEDAMDGDEDTAAAGDQRAGDNVYQITVVASGGELAVAVTVTDVDEPGEVTFDQPQPQATRDLTAIGPGDKDADVDDVSWQWSRCTTKDNADDCEDIAGATTTTRTPTADDVGMYLRATVTYTDTHGDQMASAATDNPVEPRTTANAAPEFDDIDPITVNENVEGDIGEPIMATDDDNDILLYSEDGNTGDNAMFSVSSSGQISLDDELDYETPGGGKTGNADPTDEIPDDAIVYTVMVKATDPSGAEGKSSVDVYLMDVEEIPTFGDDAPTELMVVEDETALTKPDGTGAGTALANSDYVATDLVTDGGDGDASVYGWEGADKDDFNFDSSGVLTFTGTADFEKQSSYSITLTVTDANTEEFNKLDVTVKVVDAEDEGEVDLSAREPQNGYAVVATLDDPDGGETAIKWQWYRGGDSTTATVDALVMLRPATESSQNDTCTAVGAVRENVASTASPCIIDGQTSALYTPGDDDETHLIHAVATYKDAQDPNTEETAKGSSERAVQEANPANTAPVFPDQDFNTAGDQSDTAMRSVAENMEDVNVGEPLEAADSDLLTYKLTGPDADSFEITDPAEGSNSVQIKTAVELDFEAQSMHTVVLTASDPSGAQDKITVMIEVTDADDVAVILTAPAINTAPAFDAGTATRSVDENMDKGAAVGDPVMATDEDAGDTVTYELTGSTYFEIDGDGQITTTMMLDHEAMSTHTVTVTATDSAGDSASIDVTINVDNAHTGCDTAGNMGLVNDCEALLDSKDALGGSLNWADDTAMSEWDGVTMSDDRVTAVNLRDQGLDGTISGALGRLSELTSLNLRSNADLSGEIPGALNYLTNLTVLNLHSNSHTGEIPDLSGTALQGLYLSNNDLTGGVPAWLNMMSDITDLWLTGNNLAGAMPNLSGMSSLEKLKVNGNSVSGLDAAMLPGSLRWLVAGETDTGETAPDLSSLMNLTTLWLNKNGLTGQIPVASIPTSVTALNLRDNSLNGTIPDMSGLDNLRYLYLNSNSLSGDIPGTMGNMESIERIWLHMNELTGIGAGLSNAADTLTHLYLDGNDFAEGTCLPGDLATSVANNDFDDAGLEACSQ